MNDDEERLHQLAEMQNSAVQADVDLEAALARLKEMADQRRADPAQDRIYEQLRDEVVKILAGSGPRYFLDENGFKHYAYSVVPEPLVINVTRLVDMVRRGELPEEVLDAVTVRKIVPDAFRRAILTKRITPEQLIKVGRKKKGTGHVKFSDPLD